MNIRVNKVDVPFLLISPRILPTPRQFVEKLYFVIHPGFREGRRWKDGLPQLHRGAEKRDGLAGAKTKSILSYNPNSPTSGIGIPIPGGSRRTPQGRAGGNPELS